MEDSREMRKVSDGTSLEVCDEELFNGRLKTNIEIGKWVT